MDIGLIPTDGMVHGSNNSMLWFQCAYRYRKKRTRRLSGRRMKAAPYSS
jgi:hypothetical protein